MIKQIKDLNAATIDDLNDNCQFVMDDSNDKTKKVSFNVLKQKIGSGGESGSIMPAVVGSIIPYMGTGLPEGYLMCDGSEVDKITYSELYAVIGDRFGTASDTSKFKLPKIDDARYLQGSDTPGTNVEAGLPNITGEIMFKWSGMYESEGDNNALSSSDSVTECGGGAGNSNRKLTINASKCNSIYGNSDTVTPFSITVRYLICYKRVIGKVDAMIGMPDYSREIDLSEHLNNNTTYEYTAPEDGFVSIGGMACSGTTWLKIDGKLVATGTYGVSTNDVLVDGMYPVNKGSLVEFHVHHGSTHGKTPAYMKFYPSKSSPAKISELFMGAPDWDKLTEDAKIFDKILNDKDTEEFESTGDGFLVVRCDDLNEQGLYYSQGLYVSKNGITILGYTVFGDEADHIYASVIPCSKGDKFIIGNAKIFSTGDKIPIHAYVYFVPNKKIQIDVSDVVATGNGGVIDGEMWKPATVNTVTLTTAIQEVYTVENDSAVYIAAFCPADDKAVYFYLDQAGNKPIVAFDETGGNSVSFNGATVFIKKGCKIYSKLSNRSLSCTLTFIEYKIHSLAPQIAMPDWDINKKIDVKQKVKDSSDLQYIVEKNGYVVASNSDALGGAEVRVNGIMVWQASETGSSSSYNDFNCGVYPVSVGDIVTITRGDTKIPSSSMPGEPTLVVSFYPCKSVHQSRPTDCVSYVVETGKFSSVDGTTHLTASENDSWYRLYSDGWCEMGGKKTYLASTDDNTETVTFAKSFLDTSFTLTFGAGSSGTAQDNGHIVNEDQNYRTVNTFGIQVTDPNASTKDAWNCWRAEGFVSITPKTT